MRPLPRQSSALLLGSSASDELALAARLSKRTRGRPGRAGQLCVAAARGQRQGRRRGPVGGGARRAGPGEQARGCAAGGNSSPSAASLVEKRARWRGVRGRNGSAARTPAGAGVSPPCRRPRRGLTLDFILNTHHHWRAWPAPLSKVPWCPGGSSTLARAQTRLCARAWPACERIDAGHLRLRCACCCAGARVASLRLEQCKHGQEPTG